MDKMILTTREVAELFSVVPSTVVTWAETDKLPCFRTPGGHRRFRREDVEVLLGASARDALRPSA